MKMKKITFAVFLVCFSTGFLTGHPSYGIVVNKHRNIYFADLTHHGDGTVWKLSKEGVLTALFKDFHCHNIMLDNDDNLLAEYVEQTGENDYNAFLIRLLPDGRIDTLWNEVTGNCGIALSGNIYFTDEYLWKRTPSGVITKHSDRPLHWVQSIYVDDEENIYLPDKGIDNGILLKFDQYGNANPIATGLISRLDRPRDKHNDCILGLTKGCDGHIYLTETAGQRVIKILDNQQTTTFYKSDGDWFPTGIDFFAGEAYILEYKNKGGNAGPRITKVDEAGNKTELFNYDHARKGTVIPSKDRTDNSLQWWVSMLAGAAVLGLLSVGLVKMFYKNG